MHNLKFAVLLSAALLSVSSAAVAGVSGTIDVKVVPLLAPAEATYSDPSTGFEGTIGYQVDIKNVGTNTNNKVSFTAQLSVTDGAELATLNLVLTEGVTCKATKSTSTMTLDIACSIGQLASDQSFPPFKLFFSSPVFVGANGIGDADGTDFVNFKHSTYWAEGTSGKNSPPNNFTAPALAAAVELGTLDPTLVRSVVLKTGGTFFTGKGVAAAGDPYATKVKVGALQTSTTIEIDESFTFACSSTVVTCYTSQITVPGTFDPDYLVTVISQSIENIRLQQNNKPIDIHDVPIYYTPDGSALPPLLVPACVDVGGVPPEDRPCIADYKVVTGPPNNKTILRYEWTLWGKKNGRLISGS